MFVYLCTNFPFVVHNSKKKKIIALNSPSHSDFIKKITRERCEIYSFGGGGGFFSSGR